MPMKEQYKNMRVNNHCRAEPGHCCTLSVAQPLRQLQGSSGCIFTARPWLPAQPPGRLAGSSLIDCWADTPWRRQWLHSLLGSATLPRQQQLHPLLGSACRDWLHHCLARLDEGGCKHHCCLAAAAAAAFTSLTMAPMRATYLSMSNLRLQPCQEEAGWEQMSCTCLNPGPRRTCQTQRRPCQTQPSAVVLQSMRRPACPSQILKLQFSWLLLLSSAQQRSQQNSPSCPSYSRCSSCSGSCQTRRAPPSPAAGGQHACGRCRLSGDVLLSLGCVQPAHATANGSMQCVDATRLCARQQCDHAQTQHPSNCNAAEPHS